MANVDAPRGLTPVRHASGAPYIGQGNAYYVPASYATDLFVGDPVAITTDASDATAGIQTVEIGTAGGGAYNVGVVVAVINGGDPTVTVTRDSTRYHAASTEGYVLVADAPDIVFECQEDGIAGAMGVGAVGRNVDLIAGTGSTATGYSGWELDSSTLAVTNTLQMRVVGAVERADNDPTLTNAKWLVRFNLHANRNLLGV